MTDITSGHHIAPLSLCPAEEAPARALKVTAQGMGGTCTAVDVSDTGSDEPGYYPAWRTYDAVLVAITEAPHATRAEALRWMRVALRQHCTGLAFQ